MRNYIIILLILTFLVSCNTSSYSKIEKYQQNLISTLKISDGGYSTESKLLREGNLYSTYFIVKILDEFDTNLEEENLTNLVSSINLYYDDLRGIDDFFDLNDLFYALSLSSYYGLEIPKFSKLEFLLDKHKSKEGYYSIKLNNNGNSKTDNIKTTETIIAIYKLYSKSINDNTKKWLEKQLSDVEPLLGNINDVISLNKSMKMIDNTYQVADEHLTLFNEYINKIEDNGVNNLFELKSIMDIMDIAHLNYQPSNEVINIIKQNQINGLGWNVFFEPYIEEQGTYLAINFLKKYNQKIPNQDDIVTFILDYFALNGLFTSIHETPLSIVNTYFVSELDNKEFNNEHYVNTKKNLIQLIESRTLPNTLIERYYLLKLANFFEIDVSRSLLLNGISIDTDSITSPLLFELLFHDLILLEYGSQNHHTYLNEYWENRSSTPRNFNNDLLVLSIFSINNNKIVSDSDIEQFMKKYSIEINEISDELLIWLLSKIYYAYPNPELYTSIKSKVDNFYININDSNKNELTLSQLYYMREANNNITSK